SWLHPPPMPFFFSTWLFQPLLSSSSYPSALTRIVAVGPAQLENFLEKKGYGPNQLYLGGENSLAWYNPCRGCGVRKKKILDRPRSEAAHRELSRFSRLPTPGLFHTYFTPTHFLHGVHMNPVNPIDSAVVHPPRLLVALWCYRQLKKTEKKTGACYQCNI